MCTWLPETMTEGIIRVQSLEGWLDLLDNFLIDNKSLKPLFYLLFISSGFWFHCYFPPKLHPHLTFSQSSSDLGNGLKGGVTTRRIPKLQTGGAFCGNHLSSKLSFSFCSAFELESGQWIVLLLALLINQLVWVSRN